MLLVRRLLLAVAGSLAAFGPLVLLVNSTMSIASLGALGALVDLGSKLSIVALGALLALSLLFLSPAGAFGADGALVFFGAFVDFVSVVGDSVEGALVLFGALVSLGVVPSLGEVLSAASLRPLSALVRRRRPPLLEGALASFGPFVLSESVVGTLVLFGAFVSVVGDGVVGTLVLFGALVSLVEVISADGFALARRGRGVSPNSLARLRRC